jgi:hypothetical protein
MTVAALPTFLVCKYVPDPRRQEPRNVGVVLLHPTEGVQARFLGEDLPGEIDGRKVAGVVRDTKGYDQWVTYWRYCTQAINLDDPSDPKILEQVRTSLLSSSRNNYTVVEGGEVMISGAEDKDPSALLSYVYNEIVERDIDTTQLEKIDLDRRSHQIIQDLGFTDRALFTVSPKIDVMNRRGRRERVSPSYLLINKKYNVLENIALHSSSEKSARRAIDATQYMYEKLETHAKQENNRDAVFASFIDARQEKYTYDLSELVDLLSSWGPVVNIADIEGSKQVLESIGRP